MRRLEQLIASLGYCSRKEVRQWISDGRIHIGDELAHRADQRVSPATVRVDGEPLESPEGLFVLFHKPLGCTCTHSQDEGSTIYEFVPPQWLNRRPPITSVGRLDKDTSGLLILTDRGDLVQRLTSPKADIAKTYEVTVDHDLVESLIAVFASGTLTLRNETKPCLPAELVITSPRTAMITVREGRYHQVRRMFASQGWHVEKLHRTRFGPYQLGGLAESAWVGVDPPEI